MYSVCIKKALTLHSVFDDTFNSIFLLCSYADPGAKDRSTSCGSPAASYITTPIRKTENSSRPAHKHKHTELHHGCFFHLFSSLYSLFLSLLCRHSYRTHTHTSVRNTLCFYTAMAYPETDTDVLPCYNL